MRRRAVAVTLDQTLIFSGIVFAICVFHVVFLKLSSTSNLGFWVFLAYLGGILGEDTLRGCDPSVEGLGDGGADAGCDGSCDAGCDVGFDMGF